MNLVTLDGVRKQYSERVLLDGVSLLINQGDRIGLIGLNGSGKTTLLRIIAGQESPDAGSVMVWGGVRVRYLPQEPVLDDRLTVLDTLFQSDAPQMRLLRDYEAASHTLQHRPADLQVQSRFAELSAAMDRTAGWMAEAEAKAILTRLGVADFDALIGTLSGGQRKRVALARALLDPGDLLILDEPTNHIDADSVDWLEQHLLALPAALLMVTHDRYFLDRVVNRIIELDRRQLVSYPGNYTRYLELSAERQERLADQEEDRRRLLRQELEWLHRSPSARSTKQKARKQRVDEMMSLRYDSRQDRVTMALAGRRLGKKVLTARGLAKSYESQPVFGAVDLELAPGDRLGIIGPNGAGKTTLVDAWCGFVPHDGRVEVAGRDVTGWRPHRRARAGLARTWQSVELIDDLTIAQNLSVAAPRASTDHIEATLKRVGLGGEGGSQPAMLSLGHRKLAGVARAVVADEGRAQAGGQAHGAVEPHRRVRRGGAHAGGRPQGVRSDDAASLSGHLPPGADRRRMADGDHLADVPARDRVRPGAARRLRRAGARRRGGAARPVARADGVLAVRSGRLGDSDGGSQLASLSLIHISEPTRPY